MVELIMGRLTEKVAIVTGGGSGIGKVTCERLANEGALIVVSDINASSAEATAKDICALGGDAISVEHDVASEKGWQKAIATTLEKFNKVDILVNNAAVFKDLSFLNSTLKDWQHIMSINLDGVFLGMRFAVKAMLDTKCATGSIINISSVNGMDSGATELSAAYSASKAGVRMLTKSAALECGRKGYCIRINSICPGGVNTPLAGTLGEDEIAHRQKMHPIGRCGEGIDIANGVLYLASDESSFVTGSDLVIDGGWTAGYVFGVYPDC